MTNYTLSHTTAGGIYSFYRGPHAPKPSTTTYTGYSLYINIGPNDIKAHKNALNTLFNDAQVPFYLAVNHDIGYPGKNLVVYLGTKPNIQATQKLCRELEKLLLLNNILPEPLPKNAHRKRRTIPGSTYLSYSSDYTAQTPTISQPRFFSPADTHREIEKAFYKNHKTTNSKRKKSTYATSTKAK